MKVWVGVKTLPGWTVIEENKPTLTAAVQARVRGPFRPLNEALVALIAELAVTIMGLAVMLSPDKSKGIVLPVWPFFESDKPPVPVWARLMVVDRVNPVHPAGRASWVMVRLPVPIVALTRVPEVLTGTLMAGVFTVVAKLTPWAAETVVSELRDGVVVIVSCFPKLPPEVVAVMLTLKEPGRVTLVRGMVAVPPATKSTEEVLLANRLPELSVREIFEAFRVKLELWPVVGAKSSWKYPEAKVAELKSLREMVTAGTVAETREDAPVSPTVID